MNICSACGYFESGAFQIQGHAKLQDLHNTRLGMIKVSWRHQPLAYWYYQEQLLSHAWRSFFFGTQEVIVKSWISSEKISHSVTCGCVLNHALLWKVSFIYCTKATAYLSKCLFFSNYCFLHNLTHTLQRWVTSFMNYRENWGGALPSLFVYTVTPHSVVIY